MARCRIAVVTDGSAPFEPADGLLVENLSDEAHPFVLEHPLTICRDDTGALLTAMLEGVQAEERALRRTLGPVDSKHTALFVERLDHERTVSTLPADTNSAFW